MPADLVRLAVSFGLSIVIGGLAFWRGSLTGSGWLGAILIGTATAGLGGWTWGSLIVVFFVSSSALSHWQRESKQRRTGDVVAKGAQRDLRQTLANGGVAAACAVVYALDPHAALFAAALGATAAVTADTWATELGTLSRTTPRLITTGRPVPPGTSGGVSGLGSAAASLGALVIGVSAYAGLQLIEQQAALWVIPTTFFAGLAGALADSLLGATVQRSNWCRRCAQATEQLVHRCGTVAVHQHGWKWLDNDGVNLLASVAGGVAGVLVWSALAGT